MTKDLQAAEVPKSVLWLGKRLMLCFSTGAKEYCSLDIDNGSVQSVVDAKQVSLACYIPGFRENLVVAQDTLGLRVNEQNKANSNLVTRWTQPPKSLLYVHPYLLSMHSAIIEVHLPHISQKTFCQGFPLSNLEAFSTVNYIDYDAPAPTKIEPGQPTPKRDAVVALLGDGSMRLLVPQTIEQQIASLAKERQFEEARQLENLCPSEVGDTWRQRLVLLRSNHLFELGNYKDAFDVLASARVDARFAINFFPGYLPELIRKRWTSPDDTVTQFKPTTVSATAMTELLSYLDAYPRPPEQQHAPVREITLDTMSEVALQYASIDTARMHALCDTNGDVGKLLRSANYVVFEEAQRKFAKLNDYTALGLLHLSLNEPKELGAVLHRLHHVAVLGRDDSTAELPADDVRGTALNTLMRTLVDQGLTVNRTFSVAEATRNVDRATPVSARPEDKEVLTRQLMAVTTTAAILQSLNPDVAEFKELILRHSLWLVKSFSPKYTTAIYPVNSKGLDPSTVVNVLDPYPDACNEYLQRLMGADVNAIADPQLHNSRVGSLMKLVGDSSSPVELRKRYTDELTVFLNTSAKYNLEDAMTSLERILATDRNDQLVRAQTVIFKRLSRHKDAVTLLLAANKPREAEAYAREVCDENRKLGRQGDAFRFLIEAVLKKDGDAKTKQQEVLALVGRNPHMDAVAALEVLPDTVSVSDLSGFLVNALRASDSQARYRLIHCNMLKSTHRSLDVVAALERSASVRITRESKCEVCGRGIGASIFLRYPDGLLAHHGCVQDKSVSPKSGRDFARNVELL